MKTLTVDDYQRVRLPLARPRSKFAYEEAADGRITLTPVKTAAEEPFPPGSLTQFLTAARDQEQLDRLSATVTTP
ncbi:MAG: hypothetical protein M9920_01430 [Verrucomicrobiae bacterium]|nr:hypothetical protein [Verrucomicrobiae bacterium]